MNYPIIDMFCGIGGVSHGFMLEGFDILAGYDTDASCRYAFEKNNKAKFICKDIREVDADEILSLFPKDLPKTIIGCAPCQPFSKYTQKYEQDRHGQWRLLYTFAELIRQVRPEVVSMENVPDLMNFKNGAVFNDFIDLLAECDYQVKPNLVYCPDYGIPQNRKRLVLLASRLGPIELMEQTHNPSNYKKVTDTISFLPPIEAGEICSDDPLHRSSRLSDLNLKRIRSSKPGGSWKDWERSLVSMCHKRSTGESYSGIYGRMEWDKPAPTITTQFYGFGNGRFGHPEQDRAISLREGALLQTFPANYEFVSPNEQIKIKTLGRHIGNAVPVKLARVIAHSVKRHLDNHYA
jgi:DNA (cytosine-5)-methyltransferase 1